MHVNHWESERALFEEDCKNAVSIAKDNLKMLMADNKDTEYGKKYGFKNITDYEEYQSLVPLSNYADYQEYVEKMRLGEEQQLTAYPVKHFILTSGSTGEQKRIPLTKEALRRCIRPIYYASYQGIPKIEEGKYLHMSVFRRQLPKEERDTILSVAYFGEMMDQGTYELEKRYLGAPDLLFSKNIGYIPYVKAWLALQTEEISGIQAFFLYDILLFCHWLEEHWQELLKHMEEGIIPDDIPLVEEIKKELLAMGRLTKERTEFLRNEFSKGMEDILERLWPHMNFISGVGGSTFFAQENALRKYLGKIPIHYFSYAASECMMAIVTEKESVDNVLIPKSGFYEFIPYHQGESREEEIKPIWQLKEGEMYEIVITNFSGFYRYRLNDIVKVVGFRGESPILRVCFRKNQALNIAGEKIDMQVMAKAMEKFGKQVNCQIKEFSIVENTDSVPGNYRCFYETGEKDNHLTPAAAGEILDKILFSMQEDYKDVRELGMLAAPQVYRVQTGSHGECKKVFGSLLAQNKPLQYLSKSETVEFMLERVM